jgi:hypothetical protein
LEILSSIVVAAGASVSMGLWYRYRRKQAWRQLAGKRGLKVLGGGINGSPELVGEIDGFPVRLWLRTLEPSGELTVADVAEQPLTRPGFERDLAALTGLLDEAVRRAVLDAEESEGRSPV